MKLRENLKNLTLVIAESIKALTNSKAESDLSNLSSSLTGEEKATIKDKLSIGEGGGNGVKGTPVIYLIDDAAELNHNFSINQIYSETKGEEYAIQVLFSDSNHVEIDMGIGVMEMGVTQRVTISRPFDTLDPHDINVQFSFPDADFPFSVNGVIYSNGVTTPIVISPETKLTLEFTFLGFMDYSINGNTGIEVFAISLTTITCPTGLDF